MRVTTPKARREDTPFFTGRAREPRPEWAERQPRAYLSTSPASSLKGTRPGRIIRCHHVARVAALLPGKSSGRMLDLVRRSGH